MTKTRLHACALAVLCLSGATTADYIEHHLHRVENALADGDTAGGVEPAFDAGETHYTFDLRIVLHDLPGGEPNDWMTSDADALLFGDHASFFQHPFGRPDGGSPSAAMFDAFPSLEFDSYWSGASRFGPGEAGATASFVGETIIEEQRLFATWFDAVDTGSGEQTIARFTIILDEDASGHVGTIRVRTVAASNVGEPLVPAFLHIVVPAPASGLMLSIALAACALRRR
jgi:hypothetical protein